MINSSITQSFSYRPIALFHHYLEFHLRSMKGINEDLLTEPMLFGLGCGLSFNFDRFESGAIRMNCINDWLVKDLFGHINIKAWYKTEPNSNNFIQYINKLLEKGEPVITMCNIGDSNRFNVQPVLITEYNNKDLLYSIQSNTNNIQIISSAQLIKLCDFKASNIALNNFWFEVALSPKLFPIEKAVKWALVKNVQSMLYMPGDNCGLAGLKSFKLFVSELSEINNNQEIVNYAGYFRNAINDTNNGSNRHLFANFLTLANKFLNINSIDKIVEAFKGSAIVWDQLALDFEIIERGNSGKFKGIFEDVAQKIDKIVDQEETALLTLESLIYN